MLLKLIPMSFTQINLNLKVNNTIVPEELENNRVNVYKWEFLEDTYHRNINLKSQTALKQETDETVHKYQQHFLQYWFSHSFYHGKGFDL